ncbi:hypothetical protein GQR58_010549 [Nymphon striatum]|nr:hypothetical protein GQR58_010549 [Nymphon striatum]
MGSNTKGKIASQIQSLHFNVPIDQQIVVIYNHGIKHPQQPEPCYMPYNKPPASLRSLINKNLMVYSLCSTSIESPAPTSAGKQVYLRKQEISHAIDAFLERGIQPKNLFLAGHSNGGWTSLMMMRDVNKRFNGVIAYAPAFAGKRKDSKLFPWWRSTARPNQINDMLGASEMDALVFAYDRDEYNRPQDLKFLTDRYPLVVNASVNQGVVLTSYDCGNLNAHQTFRNDCRLVDTKKRIQRFINNQIAYW